jgi:hypothetical protein
MDGIECKTALIFKPIKCFDRRRKQGYVVLRSKYYLSDTLMKCSRVKLCHAATHYAELTEGTKLKSQDSVL